MDLHREIKVSDIQKINEFKISTVKRFCIFVFTISVVLQSWLTDDAYHMLVMTKNFMNGYGLVYNIGERVNAATSPLMLLLTTLLSCLTRHIELTAVAIGIITSVATFWLLIRRLESNGAVIVATVICLLSYGFMAFSTSGLETSLICMIQVLYIDFILNHDGKYTFIELCYTALLCSLSLLARLDTCFLMFFPTAYIFLMKKECNVGKMFLAGIIGLLPFFAWLVFSILYYGYPFPNTYYIKIRNDLPLLDYLEKGINYFKVNFICDTITVITIVCALVIALSKSDLLHKMVAIGIIAKLIYLLRIGGDFMLGRHFAGLFIVSVYIIFEYEKKNKRWFGEANSMAMFLLATLFLLSLSLTARPLLLYPKNEVADERGFYSWCTSLGDIIKSEVAGINIPLSVWSGYIPEVEKAIENDYYGDVFTWAPGIMVFNYGDKIYMTDQISIPDPLLPYMDVDWQRSYFSNSLSEWRIGHIFRQIPEGYRESLQQDKNLITDSETHELYDKIRLVVRGELFTRERFQAIWELNTKYMK